MAHSIAECSDPDELASAGIWLRQADGSWVRDATRRADWSRWADVDVLPAKCPEVRRVVWLGESLARGFFFDPEATPAASLESALREAACRVEVIDLGSNGLDAQGFSALLRQLPRLQPDAVVLLAGNNWHGPGDLDEASAREALRALGSGRAELARWCRESHLPSLASRLLGELAVAARGVPVVVVVPAFNLRDWRATPSQRYPALEGEAALRWHRLHDAVVSGRAADAAREMLALDGGDSPLTHDLLASAALRRGQADRARLALEAARDASCSPFLPFLPRCPAALQRAMAREARLHGFAVVNLPEILAARSPGGIPGRQFFLDYCHMSAEGNSLLVEHIARALGESAPWAGLDAITVPVSPNAVQARAHFLAAVHNARYAQLPDILAHHCRAALALDSSVGELMAWYVEEAAAASPLWMSRDAPRFLRRGQVYRHLMAPQANDPPAFPDLPLSAVIAAIQGGEPRVGAWGDRLDLLAGRWCHRTADEWSPEAPAATTAFLRARSRESSFFLPLERPRPLALELTWRCPDESAGRLTLSVNGRLCTALEVGRAWRNAHIAVSSESLRAGINSVSLHWPVAGRGATVTAQEAELVWARGGVPDLRPYFGDLFALRAVA